MLPDFFNAVPRGTPVVSGPGRGFSAARGDGLLDGLDDGAGAGVLE
jgi:hypothetical protein